MMKESPLLSVLFILINGEAAPHSVEVAAAPPEVVVADTQVVDVGARIIEPLPTTEATLRESVMRAIWIITTHRHATFSLNSAKHSRT